MLRPWCSGAVGGAPRTVAVEPRRWRPEPAGLLSGLRTPAQVPPLNSAGTDAEAPGVPGPRAGAAGASTVRPRRRREVPAQAVAWALSRCPQPPQTPPLLAADLAQFRPAAAELSLSLLARWRRAGHCRPCFRLSSRCASWSPRLRARAPGGCWSWQIGKHGSPRFPMVGTHRAGDAFWRAPGFFGACQSSLGGRAAPSAPPTQHGDPWGTTQLLGPHFHGAPRPRIR